MEPEVPLYVKIPKSLKRELDREAFEKELTLKVVVVRRLMAKKEVEGGGNRA